MANIKFSQFTQKTTLGTVDFLVGYTGADNVQIDPADLLSDYSQGTGTAGQVTFFSATSTVTGDNNLYWDNTNKRLGIGTTTPVSALHVESANSNINLIAPSGNPFFRMANATSGSRKELTFTYDMASNYASIQAIEQGVATRNIAINPSGGNVGIGTTTPAAKLHADGTLIATGVSQLGSSGANVYLTSSSAGNVGIGTSSPGNKLHVNGGEIQVVNGTFGKLLLQNSNNYLYGDQNGVGILNANNNLRLYTAGSEKIRIDSSGKVGIGTTSPSDTLTINNDNNLLLGLNAPAGNDAQLRFYSAGNYKSIIYRPASSNDLRVNTVTSGDVLTIQQGGNVGIGTSSPSRTLHIGGPGGSSGGIMISPTSGDAEIQFQDSGTTNAYITLDDGTQDLNFRDDSATVMTIDFGGERVGIGTTSPTQALDVDGAIITEDYRSAGTFFLTSGDDWRFRSDTGSERMRITSSGDVGIGTTSPGRKLEVYNASSAGIKIQSGDANQARLDLVNTDGSFGIITNSGTFRIYDDTDNVERLKIDTNGNVVIGSGALSITADGSNAVTFTESGNGLMTIAAPDDIVLDASGDIALDAGGDDIRFRVNGTTYGSINDASSNLNIYSSIQDKDIKFLGDDGGTQITALELDMSEAGYATFNYGVRAPFFTSIGGRSFFMDNVAFVGGYSNGSGANGANDIGSNSNKWRDAYFSGQLNSATISTTGSVKADGNIALGNISGVARLQHEGSGQLKMLSSGDSTIATFTSTGSTFPSDIETTSSSKGLILKSPDGTRYRVTVANGGTLSVSAV